MQTVENIKEIEYFTQRWDIIDQSYDFSIQWKPHNIKNKYYTLPTFVSDFSNCSVNNLPVLVTEDRKIIVEKILILQDKIIFPNSEISFNKLVKIKIQNQRDNVTVKATLLKKLFEY